MRTYENHSLPHVERYWIFVVLYYAAKQIYTTKRSMGIYLNGIQCGSKLTFCSHIPQKWHILGVCSESGIKIDVQIMSLFSDKKSKPIYTHVKSMEFCWRYGIVQCIIEYVHKAQWVIKMSVCHSHIQQVHPNSPIDFLRVKRFFDYLSEKGSHLCIWAWVLVPLSPHFSTISQFVNIFK